MSTATTDAIRRLENVTERTALQPFRILCDRFRRFVSNFARTAVTLNRRLNKYQTKQFGTPIEEEKAAFETLKDYLTK